MKYTCLIAPIDNPSEETIVVIEAPNRGEALVINCQERPGTYVKSIEELVE